MRVSTPSEMTDINPLILSDIVCMFETELHSKPKNLNKYEILINFSDYYFIISPTSMYRLYYVQKYNNIFNIQNKKCRLFSKSTLFNKN